MIRRAIGPIVSYGGLTGNEPRFGTAPAVGRSPQIPFSDAGMRIEPPVSLPSATSHMPAATATPEPPLEPPGRRVSSQALRQRP
jgi:hypothetical protein